MIDEEMAEQYTKELCKTCTVDTCRYNTLKTCAIKESIKQAFLAGLNKANEWHYVKDGDLPNTKFDRVDVIVAYINVYENPCRIECCFDGTDFIYWDNRIPVGWRKVDFLGRFMLGNIKENFQNFQRRVNK